MSDEKDGIRSVFVRQRRNLMALSLLLLVADIPEKLPLGTSTSLALTVHPPFTIAMVLWLVGSYWLWRYYTAFRDLGDKGFQQQHFARFQHLLAKIAVRKFKSDPEMQKELDERLQQVNATAWKHAETYGGSKPTSLRLGLNAFIDNGWTPLITEEGYGSAWRPEIVVEGWTRTRAKYRAWVYVLFRTSLFSEYVVPFIFAFTTAGWAICRLIVGN